MARTKLTDEQKLTIINNLDKPVEDIVKLINTRGVGEKTVLAYLSSIKNILTKQSDEPQAEIKPELQTDKTDNNPPPQTESTPLPIDGSSLFINKTMAGKNGVAIMTEAASEFSDENKHLVRKNPVSHCTTQCKPKKS